MAVGLPRCQPQQNADEADEDTDGEIRELISREHLGLSEPKAGNSVHADTDEEDGQVEHSIDDHLHLLDVRQLVLLCVRHWL